MLISTHTRRGKFVRDLLKGQSPQSSKHRTVISGWARILACCASTVLRRFRWNWRRVSISHPTGFSVCSLRGTERFGLARRKGSPVGRAASLLSTQSSQGRLFLHSLRITKEPSGLAGSDFLRLEDSARSRKAESIALART